MIEKAFIYAFMHDGKFLYVGHTVDPVEREFFHTRASASRIRNRLPLGSRFVVLRETTTAESFRIERQIILNLKRRGQAVLNGNNGCKTGTNVGGYVVTHQGVEFSSLAQLERAKKGGWPKGKKRKNPTLLGH